MGPPLLAATPERERQMELLLTLQVVWILLQLLAGLIEIAEAVKQLLELL